MNIKTILGYIIFMAFVWTGFAVADDRPGKNKSVTDFDIEQLMSIEVETVYGASKFEQAVTQAPSSVSIITAEDIKRYGWRTIGDALKSVRGFYVSSDRENAHLGSRGFSPLGDVNSRYLLLIDGHRINDLALQLIVIDNGFAIDIDLIDRIEVIRGPGSSLYGSNAILGVINIITRKAKDIDGLEVSTEAGSFDTYKERISYGKELDNGLSFLLSASNTKSHGQSLYFKEYNSPATNNGRSDGCDSSRYENYFAAVSYKGLTLETAYSRADKGLPLYRNVSVFNSDENRRALDMGYVSLKYSMDIGERMGLSTRFYYNYGMYEIDTLIGFPFSAPLQFVGHEKWWGASTELTTKIGNSHTLIVGLDYETSYEIGQRFHSIIPTSQPNAQGSYFFAAHIQDQFSVMDGLLINGGIRYDHYKDFGDTVNPRLGIIYSPRKTTTLKFLYGHAFRTPNAFELYVSDGGYTSKSNSDLKPETIETYEIVLEEYFKNYRATVSTFYYRIKNLISQTIDPVDGLYVYDNVGAVESKGAELEIQGKWRGGIEGKFSYSFQETIDKDTGRTILNSPKHLAKLNFYIPIAGEKLSTGLEGQYIGPRRTRSGNTGGAFTANISFLSRGLIKGLELSGGIYNILDKQYSDPVSTDYRPAAVPQDGRTFRIKCTYKF